MRLRTGAASTGAAARAPTAWSDHCRVHGPSVMLMRPAGAYAELAAVPRAALVPLPDGATFAEGAGFVLTFLTAFVPLTRQVRLGDGATVVVHAAAGGVGTAAIQVARALGARVVAAAGSPEKLELCRELGAEEAFVYDELPDDLRADVVVDPVGGELFAAAVGRLRPLGQLLAVGHARRALAQPPAGH